MGGQAMPGRTTMGPGGTVTLPEPQAGFFQEGEQIEVAQYRHHVALLKGWDRISEGRGAGLPLRARRSMYDAAHKRMEAAVPALEHTQPEMALYLAGYLVELRLKVLVCDQWGVQYLDEAQYRIARVEGTEYDLTGGHGHSLELLLQLAGCQAMLNDHKFSDAWRCVGEWNTTWRYHVPEGVRKASAHYVNSFRAVAEMLSEVSR